MITESVVFAVVMAGVFFSAILYVVFGQITVRKLRNNPETRHELGIELISGWDIINVAQALALPRLIVMKLKETRLSSLYANAELLYKHTTLFDRLLAVLFYWLLMGSGLILALWALLDVSGILT